VDLHKAPSVHLKVAVFLKVLRSCIDLHISDRQYVNFKIADRQNVNFQIANRQNVNFQIFEIAGIKMQTLKKTSLNNPNLT
jgi:hypothetical protein